MQTDSFYDACPLCDGEPVEAGYLVNGLFYAEDGAVFCPEHADGD